MVPIWPVAVVNCATACRGKTRLAAVATSAMSVRMSIMRSAATVRLTRLGAFLACRLTCPPCDMLRDMRMLTRACLLALAIAAVGAPRIAADTYPRQSGFAITHYAFDVTLTDASSEIAMTEVVDVRFTASGVTGIDLDLCDVDGAR